MIIVEIYFFNFQKLEALFNNYCVESSRSKKIFQIVMVRQQLK